MRFESGYKKRLMFNDNRLGPFGGRGKTVAISGYPGMCRFPGYTFRRKILRQDINFEEKF